MTARIVYLGTPEFACPALKRLARRPDVEVVLVVTQPDRPAGRGRRLQATPVALYAERAGIPVYRATSLRTADSRGPIVELAPDLIVVAAFGLILGRSILELPGHGCLNLHASLLPAYRGANPIAAAIRAGARMTGVSLMRMERGLDTGPVLAMGEVDINDDDTTASLTPTLAEAAGLLLDRHLSDLLSGRLEAVPQPAEGATCTRPMTKDDGWIDWRSSAADLERHVRAMWSWPRAWTTLPGGDRLQVHRSRVSDHATGQPGRIVNADGLLVVACGDRSLVLDTVQLPGGRPVAGSVLVTRGGASPGDVLGATGAPPASAPLVCPC
ncbi:MAG TPA: methionyl-tRNA formyltransferase [Thermomicrobiales bacterium]|nr:methionyl-tRNA formyltransferase [Thermomicrobiales bacterium]